MKKLLCALLTLSLIFCAAALAEDTYDEDDSTASTTLTTTIKGPDGQSHFPSENKEENPLLLQRQSHFPSENKED